ncbi:DUF302 domain-containing protein [Roseovarius sp. M141]|uniref:DUF302 domain-containing protein n=1 Tax=Roseovarius sp. M141 TaxID=2583806 RepID=UPI0020CBCC49|nr:DUF302 domain-containing protein [Roseovarius sp. M141]MCQ0092555.1 DUF302 domain-containing protein [Roseovarius sp. M141]
MRPFFTAVALSAITVLTAPAWAGSDDLIRVKAAGDVPATMDALEQAVEGAGATVFARVDHAAGAEAAGMELAPAQLLIFGNPKLGTPAMQDDALAGLYLPLKVLVYRDGDGQVWLTYDDPAQSLGDLDGIAPDAGYIAKMTGALAKLTGKASGM